MTMLYIFLEINECGWASAFSTATSKEAAQQVWDGLKDGKGGSVYEYIAIEQPTGNILGQMGHHRIIKENKDWMLSDPTVKVK